MRQTPEGRAAVQQALRRRARGVRLRAILVIGAGVAVGALASVAASGADTLPALVTTTLSMTAGLVTTPASTATLATTTATPTTTTPPGTTTATPTTTTPPGTTATIPGTT